MRSPYAKYVRGILAAIAGIVMVLGVIISVTAPASKAEPAGVHVPPAVETAQVMLRPSTELAVHSKQVQPKFPLYYFVRHGDTLSIIAAREYGASDTWPALWWVNRHIIPNPNNVTVGEKLVLSSWHPVLSWLSRDAMNAIPAPPASVNTASYVTHYSSSGNYGHVNPYSFSGFEQCVISRESGGNSQVMNASGHYGLFQFSFGTWVAYGGAPGLFGHASAAYQEQIFNNAMARGGAFNWAPYDGC